MTNNAQVEFLHFNETDLIINANGDRGIVMELSAFFAFYVENYKFSPKYKAGLWDGQIRIYDNRTGKLPKGLLKIAIHFCKTRGYTFSIDQKLNPLSGITENTINTWMETINPTSKQQPLVPRDYQIKTILHLLKYNRSLIISPTSSGKSLMLYYKMRYHVDVLNHRVVLIVPTTQLVEQMCSDFADYSYGNKWDVGHNVQLLYSGKEKIQTKSVLISTWQSLAAMSKFQPECFSDITSRADALIVDECHKFSSVVTLGIVQKFSQAVWRCGVTGTLDDSKINKLQLIGLFSDSFQVVTTRELMDNKSIVELDIKICKIDYPKSIKEAMNGQLYQEEVDFLVTYEPRNRFICSLASRCSGVTLVLYTFVNKHGAVLNDMIRAMNPDRPVRFIHGGVGIDEREEARQIAEASTEKNVIIIASSAIFSTGTNIPAIENVIFAMPTKSTVRVRQSIGRGLRLQKGKTKCTLYDIADNLAYKNYQNTTLKHLTHRLDIYKQEQFKYTINNINIENFISDAAALD